MRELPASPADVTPNWLSEALRDGGVPPRGVIAAVHWEIIGEEWGFTGVVARLRPTYTDESADVPVSLVAKFPTAERTFIPGFLRTQGRDEVAARRHFERSAREVRFFHQIAPVSPLPTPRCYFGAADEATGRIVLLLEDLASARQGDALLGGSASDVAQIFDAIAPFHAAWWGRTHGDDLAWLPRWSRDRLARQERYDRRVDRFLTRFGARLPAELQEMAKRLRGRWSEVFAALDRAPETIIHADLHLDNVLFTTDDPARPVVVLDWQGASIGAAVADVAHVLTGSLAPDERRAVESDLLRQYHASLLAEGINDYPFARFRDDLRFALLCQFAFIVIWFADLDVGNYTGRERALVDALLDDGRLVGALLDHEVGAVLR